MKISIKVDYSRDPETNALTAEVSIGLPAEDGSLSRLLRCTRSQILERKLTSEWGEYRDGYRWAKIVVKSITTHDLENQVQHLIQNTLKTLKEVKESNEKLLAEKIPQSFEQVVEI